MSQQELTSPQLGQLEDDLAIDMDPVAAQRSRLLADEAELNHAQKEGEAWLQTIKSPTHLPAAIGRLVLALRYHRDPEALKQIARLERENGLKTLKIRELEEKLRKERADREAEVAAQNKKIEDLSKKIEELQLHMRAVMEVMHIKVDEVAKQAELLAAKEKKQ